MMIRIGFVIFLTSLQVITSGQTASHSILDQFMISVNHTLEESYGTKNRIGFGIGMYHNFLPKSWLNFNLGLEFNRTRQLETSEIYGHFGHYINLAYSKNCISLPINLRTTLGKRIKYFLEFGGFWDGVISSKQKGLLYTNVPDANGNPQPMYFDVNKDAELRNSFGVSFGIGIRIPSKQFDIIIKPDYKYKFNKWYYDKDRKLSKYLRLNFGINLK